MKPKNYLIKIMYCIILGAYLNVSAQESNRISQLKLQLESILVDAPGLVEKADINVSNVILPDFLRALANAHKVNLNISPTLGSLVISNNYSNATVADILIFLCKEYELTLELTGNIIAIKKLKAVKKQFKQKTIPLVYDAITNKITLELNQDSLFVAFKSIMNKTGKNLVFAPGMEHHKISAYIQEMPFDKAMENIAYSNNLTVNKTRDNYFVFESNNFITNLNNNSKSSQNRPVRNRSSNFFFKVINKKKQLLEVDFENTSIANIINDIGRDLDINMFTSAPLDGAGKGSVRAKNIAFNLLLRKLLENTDFTYQLIDGIYYFGKKDQVSLRHTEIVPLLHRSIEIMNSDGHGQRRAGRTTNSNSNNYNTSYNNQNNFSNLNTDNQSSNFNQRTTNRNPINTNRSANFSSYSNKTEALINILPEDILKELTIKTDIELNSFIVSGPRQNIEKFKEFITYIDKPIPVINIEVMILEINKSATIETGISWGIGDEPVTTSGAVFPSTDLTIGATDANKIINRFNGFGSLNIGKVLPNFYVNIKAMESNGNVKVRSTPRLSTLNGHRANLSIGETTYYAVTDRNYYGSQNPQTSEIKNYQPIDAELAINIRPLVSGDGQITMEINVIQSSFNGKRIDENAPPGINSREFTSIVRVHDQDLIILGGLEEKIKNDSGSGVPLLARIPIIKWFFSKRKREDTIKKLVILIKPIVIY